MRTTLPVAPPLKRCGRPVYRGFNVRVPCLLPKGHKGPCQ